jgi:hypothetical protein
MTSMDLVVGALMEQNRLAAEGLTQTQLGEAIKQAIACGEFTKYIVVDSGAQTVVYIPFSREQQLEGRIKRLEKMLANAGVTDIDKVVAEEG